MKRVIKYLMLSLVLAFTSAPTSSLQAQCPMCKMSAESNMKAGGSAGAGLNKGILYMLCMPYIIVGTLGFIWYKNRKKESDLESEDSQLLDPSLN